MLTENDLNQMKTQANHEDVVKLINEVERLKQYVKNYNASVSQKVDTIESDMVQLEAENQRLISAKEAVYVERDACLGLIAQLALANGLVAGTAAQNQIVVYLPSGQVSWEFNESESYLFEALPPYPTSIETIGIEEKYRRVMEPGIQVSTTQRDS